MGARARARAGGTGRRLASTRHGGQAAGGGERATPHPQTTGPAVAATLAPSLATSTSRYALPLVFLSCCAKPCAQALTYYSYSDLNLVTSVYACIMPTNLDGFVFFVQLVVHVYTNVLHWIRHTNGFVFFVQLVQAEYRCVMDSINQHDHV